MDYRKIIRNQNTRFKILSLLKWVPDSIMLRLQYRIQMGFWPDFKHPKRYSEKIQLYKMRYRNPVMFQCVDKYDVREYVKSKGLEHILNECYGVFERAEEIDLKKLPHQFVAKTTDGSGGFNTLIVDDKSLLNEIEFRKVLNSWLGKKDVNAGREWAYTGIKKSRIVVEKLLSDKEGCLDDYKFMCFNGQVKCIWVDKDRNIDHKRGFWDSNLNYMNVEYFHPMLPSDTMLPHNIKEMMRIASILSEDFPHARIDLYNVDGSIYFGEITFYCSSGYCPFKPDSFDFELGDCFKKYR